MLRLSVDWLHLISYQDGTEMLIAVLKKTKFNSVK